MSLRKSVEELMLVTMAKPIGIWVSKVQGTIHPRINEIWYFDSIPEENFRLTKPVLNLESSQSFSLLDPGFFFFFLILEFFKVSILPSHKYLSLFWSPINSTEIVYLGLIFTLSKQCILVNNKLKLQWHGCNILVPQRANTFLFCSVHSFPRSIDKVIEGRLIISPFHIRCCWKRQLLVVAGRLHQLDILLRNWSLQRAIDFPKLNRLKTFSFELRTFYF